MVNHGQRDADCNVGHALNNRATAIQCRSPESRAVANPFRAAAHPGALCQPRVKVRRAKGVYPSSRRYEHSQSCFDFAADRIRA